MFISEFMKRWSTEWCKLYAMRRKLDESWEYIRKRFCNCRTDGAMEKEWENEEVLADFWRRTKRWMDRRLNCRAKKPIWQFPRLIVSWKISSGALCSDDGIDSFMKSYFSCNPHCSTARILQHDNVPPCREFFIGLPRQNYLFLIKRIQNVLLCYHFT